MVSLGGTKEFHIYSLLDFGKKIATGNFDFLPTDVTPLKGIYNSAHSVELNKKY